MSQRSGGCLCGAVRYEFGGRPRIAVTCHCRACQHVSDGASTYVMIVTRSDLAVVRGMAKAHWMGADSGTRVTREFCEACGRPLFARNEKTPALLAVKVGSLDDPSDFRPQIEMWTASAQPWHVLDAACRTFPAIRA